MRFSFAATWKFGSSAPRIVSAGRPTRLRPTTASTHCRGGARRPQCPRLLACVVQALVDDQRRALRGGDDSILARICSSLSRHPPLADDVMCGKSHSGRSRPGGRQTERPPRHARAPHLRGEVQKLAERIPGELRSPGTASQELELVARPNSARMATRSSSVTASARSYPS